MPLLELALVLVQVLLLELVLVLVPVRAQALWLRVAPVAALLLHHLPLPPQALHHLLPELQLPRRPPAPPPPTEYQGHHLQPPVHRCSQRFPSWRTRMQYLRAPPTPARR